MNLSPSPNNTELKAYLQELQRIWKSEEVEDPGDMDGSGRNVPVPTGEILEISVGTVEEWSWPDREKQISVWDTINHATQ